MNTMIGVIQLKLNSSASMEFFLVFGCVSDYLEERHSIPFIDDVMPETKSRRLPTRDFLFDISLNSNIIIHLMISIDVSTEKITVSYIINDKFK